jgi:hypothetical protein
MALNPFYNPNQRIPNDPFYYPETDYLMRQSGPIIVGSGLYIDYSAATLNAVGGGAGAVSVVYPITNAGTPATPIIGIAAATTTTQGSVELATVAEADARTDATRAVTPASLINYLTCNTFTARGQLLTATGPGVSTLLNAPVGLPAGCVLVTDPLTPSGLNWSSTAGAFIPCSCLIAKGSIITAPSPSTPTALPVGVDGSVLVADSSQALGLRWDLAAGAFIPCACIVAKGTLITGSVPNVPLPLAVGLDGEVLMADSACALGLKWTSSTVAQATPIALGTVYACTPTGGSFVHLGQNSGSGSTAADNIFVGNGTGSGWTGIKNVLIGTALPTVTDLTQEENTIIGYGAGSVNQSWYNTIIGSCAGTLGEPNSATLVGNFAGPNLPAGVYNQVVVGAYAGNTASGDSVSIGTSAGNCAGFGSVALGYYAGTCNQRLNISIGYQAGGGAGACALTNNNIAIGYQAGFNTRCSNNIFIGCNAGGGAVVTPKLGNSNIGIGRFAGCNSVYNGTCNILIGDSVVGNAGAVTNQVIIGHGAPNLVSSNIVNLYNGVVNASFQGAAAGWTFLSDARDKSDVEDLALGLDFIREVKPRKFKWDIRDSEVDKGKEAAGFIAQEVLEVTEKFNAPYSGLVGTDNPDQYTLASTNFIPFLVNAVKELAAEVDKLKDEIQTLKNQ